MIVLGIDPGTYKSGWVLYDTKGINDQFIVDSGDSDNDDLLGMIFRQAEDRNFYDHMAIEEMEGMGFAVGKETFETAIWIGRFIQAWRTVMNRKETRIRRGDEKIVICGRKTFKNPKTGRPKAINDAQIKAALKERFPQTGGGATPSVGTKGKPGPLYGLKGHAWQALAVIVTYLELEADNYSGGRSIGRSEGN